MDELLKEINSIIGDFDGSQLTMEFYCDGSIAFYVYEQKIPIVVDKEDRMAYFDADLTNNRLTGDMLSELASIVKLIDDNIDIVISCY